MKSENIKIEIYAETENEDEQQENTTEKEGTRFIVEALEDRRGVLITVGK